MSERPSRPLLLLRLEGGHKPRNAGDLKKLRKARQNGFFPRVSSGLAAMLTHLDRGPVRPIWTSDLQMICLVLSPDVWGYLFQQPQKMHAVTLRAHTAAVSVRGDKGCKISAWWLV